MVRLDRLAPKVLVDPGPVGVDRLERRPVGHSDGNHRTVARHPGVEIAYRVKVNGAWQPVSNKGGCEGQQLFGRQCIVVVVSTKKESMAAEKAGQRRMIREQKTREGR